MLSHVPPGAESKSNLVPGDDSSLAASPNSLLTSGRQVPGTPSEVAPGVSRRLPQRWINAYQRNIIRTDIVIIVFMVFSSQSLRLDQAATVSAPGTRGLSYYLVSSSLAVSWVAALALNGVWDKRVLGAGASEYRRLIQASLYLFGFIAIIAFLARLDVARSYLAMALPLGLSGLLAGRWVWRLLLREHRRIGSHMNTVLVIGDLASATSLATRLRTTPNSGYSVSGLCVPETDLDPVDTRSPSDFVVVGFLTEVLASIERAGVNTVAVSASSRFGSEQVRRLAWQLEGSGVGLILAPALTDVAGPRIHIKPVAGLPLMHVQEPQFRGPKLLLKIILDMVVAASVLVILSPVLAAVAALIKMDDGGPVFFRHERVGRSGKTFKVWKFRSMSVNADHLKQEVRALAGQDDAIFFKSVDDPRVTKIGSFMRRTSIDELPQLFNVLGGDMSIVGPRPLVPGEGAEIGNFLERRMLVKPGITGLWQVSGRSDVNAQERIRLDFYYVENWSMAGDLLIIAKTIRTVLSGDGAY